MKKSTIKKSDVNRVLLSETSPEDVPVIFSNNWFYKHMDEYRRNLTSSDFKKDIIEKVLLNKSESRDFIPLKYSIIKSRGGLRHLGILHPASQNQMVDLYCDFEQRILSYTTKSPFSIRAPYKVSTKCYYNEKIFSKNDQNIPSTYFSYRNYNRLSSFFGSKEFLDLELKYTNFWSLDISRFFESIYTHSISWAIKGKGFAKQSRASSDFASFFDKLMQRSNFNETNGIIIGNEVSRVFAEIILQSADTELKEELTKLGLSHGVHYDIKRYVDDYFIFSSDDSTLQKISSTLESILRFYKLHFNENKTVKVERPFITGVTRARLNTEDSINWFFSVIFKSKDSRLCKISKPSNVKRKFIDKVMAGAYQDDKSYYVMCGYVISALHNKLLILKDTNIFSDSDYVDVKNSLLTLLEVAFHLFNVSPTSNNSVKLCSICNLTHEIFSSLFPKEIDTVVLAISSFIKSFFDSCVVKQRQNLSEFYVPIEFANLLCVSSSMGSEYLLSPKVVKEVFGLDSLTERAEHYLDKEDCIDYFNIVSVLFYIKDKVEYSRIREQVVKEINKRLTNLERVGFDSRICFLLLDCMSCPYIELKKRKQWALKLEKVFYQKALPSDDSSAFLQQLIGNRWFICWDDQVVLENLTHKNTLLFGY